MEVLARGSSFMPVLCSTPHQVTRDVFSAETPCFNRSIARMALQSISQYKQGADGASEAHETFPAVSLHGAKEEAITAAVPRGPARPPGTTCKSGKSSAGSDHPPHYPSFTFR